MANSKIVTEAKIRRVVNAMQKSGLTISERIITSTEVRLLFGEKGSKKETIIYDGAEPWDEDDGLYWDGKRLKVENKVTLNLWQNTLAAITAGSALVVAAVSVIAYICPPQ